VCFPAYNEERSIRAVLEHAHRLLSASGLDYEVLVCDDGSTDATGAIIDQVKGAHPDMCILRHHQRQGIFLTFEELYAAATKEWVFLNATDGQWKTEVLFDLLPLTSSADIIIASRRRKHYRWARSVISWMFNVVPTVFFGVKTYDAGAVKLVRREIISAWQLVSRSGFSEAERLIRAARSGYRIRQYPVETSPRVSGQGRGGDWRLIRGALIDVVRVWLALHRESRSPLQEGRPSSSPLP
jgi:glycosyltransferase involved in cell wall biosynthesis